MFHNLPEFGDTGQYHNYDDEVDVQLWNQLMVIQLIPGMVRSAGRRSVSFHGDFGTEDKGGGVGGGAEEKTLKPWARTVDAERESDVKHPHTTREVTTRSALQRLHVLADKTGRNS